MTSNFKIPRHKKIRIGSQLASWVKSLPCSTINNHVSAIIGKSEITLKLKVSLSILKNNGGKIGYLIIISIVCGTKVRQNLHARVIQFSYTYTLKLTCSSI